jgi:hypothetical protein
MKLADIEIDELILAIETVQQEWINTSKEEKRQATDAEVVTMCFLHALAHVFRKLGTWERSRQFEADLKTGTLIRPKGA